jgi:hypothetical protein
MFARKNRDDYLAQLDYLLKGLEKNGLKFFESKVKEEFNEQWIRDSKILGKDKKSINPSFKILNSDSLQLLIDNSSSEFKSVLRNAYANVERSINLLNNEIRQRVLFETGANLLSGGTRKELSKRLKEILNDDGITGLTYKTKPSKVNPEGKLINLSLESYTKGLALTTVRNARINATVQRVYMEEGDLVKVSSHGNPSPLCDKWQGKILSVSGKDKRYPSLDEAMTWMKGYGLFHRYCRHNITPYFDTDIEFDKALEGPKDRKALQ